MSFTRGLLEFLLPWYHRRAWSGQLLKTPTNYNNNNDADADFDDNDDDDDDDVGGYAETDAGPYYDD